MIVPIKKNVPDRETGNIPGSIQPQRLLAVSEKRGAGHPVAAMAASGVIGRDI